MSKTPTLEEFIAEYMGRNSAHVKWTAADIKEMIADYEKTYQVRVNVE